jgi:hypothetical protein
LEVQEGNFSKISFHLIQHPSFDSNSTHRTSINHHHHHHPGRPHSRVGVFNQRMKSAVHLPVVPILLQHSF